MVIEFKFGSSGEAVRDLQRKLATLHDDSNEIHAPFYSGPCDGFYNRGMEKAILAFKSKNAELPAGNTCDEQTWRKIDNLAGSVFAETWQFEYEALRGKTMPADVDPVEESLLKRRVHADAMAGLAFSGGGIRSATFNLGILQALAELRLLRDFDYLSTVSGGGYIGSWFSKWLHRLGGDMDQMEPKLATVSSTGAGKREPEEIRFLRQYSNYLTAKTGFFSADTWTVLSTYVRNTLLNLTILVAVMGALLVVPRMLVMAASEVPGAFLLAGVPVALTGKTVGAAAIIAVLWSVFWIAVSISTRSDRVDATWISAQSQGNVIRRIVLPLMVAAILGSLALWDLRASIATTWTILGAGRTTVGWAAAAQSVATWLVLPGLFYFAAWGLGWMLAQRNNAEPPGRAGFNKVCAPPPPSSKPTRLARTKEGIGHFLCALGALAVGSLLVILTTSALARIKVPPDAHHDQVAVHVLAFGMPILLSLFGITMILSVGLVGRMYSEKSREWWSRQGAWTSIFVIAWLALVSVSLYAPALLAWAHSKSEGWFTAALGSAWLGTTLAGLLLGKSSATGQQDSRGSLEFIAAAAPYVFSVGMLILVSALVHALTGGAIASPTGAPVAKTFGEFVRTFNAETLAGSWLICGVATIAMLLIGLLLAARVDINKFSMHMMYRNRLVRAYLGASNDKRQPHRFTGFDENDDLNFDALMKSASTGRPQRPYHIVNTALNMVNGKELAWQTRKAGGFTFTPAFCGFELPSMASPGGAKIADEALRGAYRRTDSYRKCEFPNKQTESIDKQIESSDKQTGSAPPRDDDGIKLGMAVAVSGAAASPNMGFHSSPPLAFLMTLFNVRLGRWFTNTRRPIGAARHTTPGISLLPLFSELFGLTDAKSEYVYLSDGGHFENLGVYELVRRRCRLIIVIDAGADGKLNFDDLGNAIRKCATDLHIEIDINVARIDLIRDAQFSLDHCVAGTIDYSKADGVDAPNGTILYIKPSLLGTERAELLNYSKTNKAFPHQSTTDQWFDETQFESYRSLGYEIGKAALAEPAAAAISGAGPGHDIAALCAAIDAKWNPSRAAGSRGVLRAVGV